MASLIDEHTQFFTSSGAPIVSGKIYIGERNLNPVSNPITVYSDRGLTTVLSQPIATDANGRSSSKIWIPGRYSLRVDNSADVQQYQELDNGPEKELTAEQSTASGATVTFSGIPAWVKTIDINMDQVSSNGTDQLGIRLGTSGGLDTSAYNGSAARLSNSVSPAVGLGGTAIPVLTDTALESVSGIIRFSLQDEENNNWCWSGTLGGSFDAVHIVAGSKALSGALTQIQFFWIGTDNFDNGAISLTYS